MTRFDPTVEDLKRSLEWHAQVTTDLQGRVSAAEQYVRRRIGDKELLRILRGEDA